MRSGPQDPLSTSGNAARTVSGRTVGGRYRLESILGRGGMGVVWAAHDELLGRDVAVKEVIAPSGLDDADRELLRARTLREARTAARISDEGVVAVLDAVEDDGRPWIVMERLPPRTLENELTERGGLPPREVAQIASSLLAGLAAAHRAGILHRDVKPSNVMFRDTPRGRRAVLADFGIAHVDGDATLTATGQMMGSPAYIAPERARGERASAASDLWSLGVTLWAAVEGWSPFQRVNSLASLTAVITEEPPPAGRAGPLQPLLEGLLRKDPSRRIDAATARRLLVGALEAFDVPVAPPPAAAVPPRRPTPRGTTTPSASAAPSVPPGSVGTSPMPVAAPPLAPNRAPAPVPVPSPQPVPDPDPSDADPADTLPWWTPGSGTGGTGNTVSTAGSEGVGRRRRRPLAVLGGVVVVALVGLGAAAAWGPDETLGGEAASPSTSESATQSGSSTDPAPDGRDDPATGVTTDADDPVRGTPADDGAAGAADPGADTGDGPGTEPGAGPGVEPGAGAGAAGGTGPEGAGSPPPDAVDPAVVPAGFERYTDPTGFSVAVPAGWQAEREGPRVYLHDPASAAYLLVDQTDTPAPDPVADWQQQEPSVARRLAGYTRLGEITPVDYRGWQAADWEFVFGPQGRTHVLNRNVITAPDQAYALYWSVPSALWEAMRPTHDVVVATFQPAG